MKKNGSGFAALRHRNFRLYLMGQGLSQAGTWMQTVGMGWLVLKVTGSGGMLGLVSAAQFMPTLLFGAFAGTLADRHSRWHMLQITQVLAAVIAIALGVMVVTDTISVWSLFVLAAAFGTVNAFDMPIRSSFVYELVGPDDITSAVGIGSTTNNAARIIGPGAAGVLIAAFGLAVPFLVNGVSFLAITIALLLMRQSEFVPKAPVKREKGQIREGIKVVWADSRLRTPMLMTVVIGMLAYENQISLPLFAKYTFDREATGYGILSSVMGVGSVIGGLLIARFGRATHKRLGFAAAFLGGSMLLAAVMPTFWTMSAALLLVGAGSVAFITMNSATLQLTSPVEVRGRVMALYITAIIGTTPIGGPIIGWIGQHIGPRA
ncbi:MAG TPA: MFS transporter, partial [Acidimicrobiaceae bacterium]|nr:MFS transporter [Acidimicrobiaceae bacterium]